MESQHAAALVKLDTAKDAVVAAKGALIIGSNVATIG
jgi:hypothetical protein